MRTLQIQLSERDFFLMLAALMITEDAPEAYRCSLAALRQRPATDGEIVELGERILTQLDPQQTL